MAYRALLILIPPLIALRIRKSDIVKTIAVVMPMVQADTNAVIFEAFCRDVSA